MKVYLLILVLTISTNAFAAHTCGNLPPLTSSPSRSLIGKYLWQGFTYEDQGNLDLATLCASKVSSVPLGDLQNAQSYNLKGLIFLKQKKYPGAREQFQSAYDKFPKQDSRRKIQSLMNIAETYNFENNQELNVHYLEMAQSQATDPQLKSVIMVRKAWAFKELGRLYDAEAAFEAVLKLDLGSGPEKFELYLGLIGVIWAQANSVKALQTVDYSIAIFKSDEQLKLLHLLKGQILLELKNFALALSEFSEAQRIGPTDKSLDGLIYSGLMNCYAFSRDYDNYLLIADQFEKTPHLESEREKAGIYITKGWAFLSKRKYKLSRQNFESAITLKSQDKLLIPAYKGLIETFFRQNLLKEMRPIYVELLNSGLLDKKEMIVDLKGYFSILAKLPMSFPDIMQVMGELQYYSKDHPTILIHDAVWKIIAALSNEDEKRIQSSLTKINTNKAFEAFFWGVFYFKSGKLDKSKDNFEKLLSINSESPAALAGLENLAAINGENILALRYYIKTKHLTDESRYNVIQNPLSLVYINFKKDLGPKKFSSIIPVVGLIMPEYKRVVVCTVGLAYADLNLLPEARKYFRMAVDLGDKPDEAHPDWPYLGLGMVASKEGHFDEAEKYFAMALKRESNSRATWHILGEHYLRLNSKKKASEAFLKVVAPANPSIGLNGEYEEIEFEAVSSAFLRLGDLASNDGHVTQANEYFQNAKKYGLAYQKQEAQEKIKKLN